MVPRLLYRGRSQVGGRRIQPLIPFASRCTSLCFVIVLLMTAHVRRLSSFQPSYAECRSRRSTAFVHGNVNINPKFHSATMCQPLFSKRDSDRSGGGGDRSSSTSKNGSAKLGTTKRQTIAVVGSGAVGSYYGARLWEAGHDVRFYMREPHLSACSTGGLNVTSIDGDIFIPSEEIRVHGTTESMGPVDWVIVCLKSTSLDAIPDLIYPLLSLDTRVVAIMNGLIEDDLIRVLKEKAKETDFSAPLQCCKALYGGTLSNPNVCIYLIVHGFCAVLNHNLYVFVF